jgi:hypothetical protein
MGDFDNLVRQRNVVVSTSGRGRTTAAAGGGVVRAPRHLPHLLALGPGRRTIDLSVEFPRRSVTWGYRPVIIP